MADYDALAAQPARQRSRLVSENGVNMDHNDLQPDWERDDLSRRAALDARLQDMVCQHLADDAMYPRTATNLASDLVEHDEVLAMLNRFALVIENQAILLYGGRREALDAFKRNLIELRAIATRGAEE